MRNNGDTVEGRADEFVHDRIDKGRDTVDARINNRSASEWRLLRGGRALEVVGNGNPRVLADEHRREGMESHHRGGTQVVEGGIVPLAAYDGRVYVVSVGQEIAKNGVQEVGGSVDHTNVVTIRACFAMGSMAVPTIYLIYCGYSFGFGILTSRPEVMFSISI